MRKGMLLFLVSFLMLGCTKFGKNVTIKGRVLNPVTGEGIADAEIWLQKTTIGLPGGLKTVKKATSSSDGSFELDKFGLAGYTAICIAGDRYDLGWTQDGGVSFTGNLTLSIKKGKVMHADYYAVPYGNLKHTIKNTSCFDQFDTLVLNINYQLPNLPLYNTTSVYTGCFEYVGTVYSKLPMGWYYFSGYYKKNNIVTTFNDSIYIDNGGYHEWVFEY